MRVNTWGSLWTQSKQGGKIAAQIFDIDRGELSIGWIEQGMNSGYFGNTDRLMGV